MMRGGQNLSAACALVSARRAKLFISTPSTPLPEKILSVLKLWWGLGGDFLESLPHRPHLTLTSPARTRL